MASNIGGQMLSRPKLLSLPISIKERIWTFAIVVSEGITPAQLVDKSNKFVWSSSQVDRTSSRNNVAGAPPLASVQLSMVCKQIYDEVAGTGLFYKVNNFNLRASDIWNCNTAISYLVGITTPRTHSIRSVTCDWNTYGRPNGAHLFALLGACQGLREMHVIVPYDFALYNRATHIKSGLAGISGAKELFVAVRGLKTFTLNVSCPADQSAISGYSGNHNPAQLAALFAESQALCAGIELLVKEYKNEPRDRKFILQGKIGQAKLLANLNVHGDGRLGGDKKPSVVASRTREQLKRMEEELKSDGTLKEKKAPRYDQNGEFTWYIEDVLDSREVAEGIPSVEFKIACQESHVYRYDNTTFELWEDVSGLTSYPARQCIIDFYKMNPDAYGKKVVHDTWKLGGGLDKKEASVNRDYEKSLGYLIRRQDRLN